MRNSFNLVAVIFFAFHAVWGALPNAATAGLIVWVDPDGDGQTPDQEGAPEWMGLLQNAGHTVVGQALSNSDGTLSAAEKVSLNAADLVILGPDSSSFGLGSPDSGADWNSLTAPLIAMNSRVIDSHDGSWNWASFAGAFSGGTGGIVADPTDPILDGVGESQVTTLTSSARFGGSILYFGGTKVVSTAADGTGFTVIGRWEAENSEGNLAGDRIFFSSAADGDTVPNYKLTPTGETLFVNSVNSLVAIPEPSSLLFICLAGLLVAVRQRLGVGDNS